MDTPIPSFEIYNTDAWRFIKSLADKSVDSIITDPMYDDELNIEELRRICRGHIITFCAPEHAFYKPDEMAYWIKTPSTKNYSRRLGRFVEWILIERHGDTFNTDLHWSNYTGVYDDRLLEKQIHPFQKPLSLMERLVRIYTRPGDLVFDPFFGSGSGLRAAIANGRQAMGCEIDPGYYDRFSKTMETYFRP